jgi:hypothetical protein
MDQIMVIKPRVESFSGVQVLAYWGMGGMGGMSYVS